MLDLRAGDKCPGEGVILEATLEKGHGVVVDCLVTWGVVKVGDVVVVGREFGKVRRLLAPGDTSRDGLERAGPSTACRVVGLKGLPAAGDRLAVAKDEARAKQIAKLRADQEVSKRMAETAEFVSEGTSGISARTGQLSRLALRKARLAEYKKRAALAATGGTTGAGGAEVAPRFSRHDAEKAALEAAKALEAARAARSAVLQFPIVVKVDSHGSIAAVLELVAAIPDDKVSVQMVHIDVGPVTMGDLDLATAADKDGDEGGPALGAAPIFAFNVTTNGGDVTAAAKKAKVTINGRVVQSARRASATGAPQP